jgi:hypothetical protein
MIFGRVPDPNATVECHKAAVVTRLYLGSLVLTCSLFGEVAIRDVLSCVSSHGAELFHV